MVGSISAGGSVSVVSSGDDGEDRDRLRLLERVLDWDSLPIWDFGRDRAAHAAYEESRLREVARLAKRKAKKKADKGIDGVRERYI